MPTIPSFVDTLADLIRPWRAHAGAAVVDPFAQGMIALCQEQATDAQMAHVARHLRDFVIWLPPRREGVAKAAERDAALARILVGLIPANGRALDDGVFPFEAVIKPLAKAFSFYPTAATASAWVLRQAAACYQLDAYEDLAALLQDRLEDRHLGPLWRRLTRRDMSVGRVLLAHVEPWWDRLPQVELADGLIRSIAHRHHGLAWALGERYTGSLPVQSFLDDLPKDSRAGLRMRLVETLDSGLEWLGRELWTRWVDACASTDLDPTYYEIRAEARDPDPRTERPGWHAYLTDEEAEPTGDVEETAYVQAAAHLVRVPYGQTPDIAPFEAALEELGPGPYAHHQEAFLTQLLMLLTAQERLPDALRNPARTPVGLGNPYLPHDRATRVWAVDAVLARINLAELPELAQTVLEAALDSPQVDLWLDRFLPHLDPTKQTYRTALFTKVVAQDLWAPASHLTRDLTKHTDATIVGQALVWQMAQGRELSTRFGDLSRWPLPVRAWWDHQLETLGVAGEPDEAESYPRLAQLLEKAIDRPNYPPDLRGRLYEACRELRPHVFEDRYRAQERQAQLKATSTSAGRSRPRA